MPEGSGPTCGATLIHFHVGQWPTEKQHLHTHHNDALVAHDLAVAWSLGCAEDEVAVSLSDFVALYQAAIAPLGGLTSWERLHGGPEWIGTRGIDGCPAEDR